MSNRIMHMFSGIQLFSDEPEQNSDKEKKQRNKENLSISSTSIIVLASMHTHCTQEQRLVAKEFQNKQMSGPKTRDWELETGKCTFVGQIHGKSLCPATNAKCRGMFGWEENKIRHDSVVSLICTTRESRICFALRRFGGVQTAERETGTEFWFAENELPFFQRRKREGLSWRQKVRRHVK